MYEHEEESEYIPIRHANFQAMKLSEISVKWLKNWSLSFIGKFTNKKP